MSRGLEDARAAHNASTPTAPEAGLQEAVEALASQVAANVDQNANDATDYERGYVDAIGYMVYKLREALATHPSPPLPGQPGVAEVVAGVLAVHTYVIDGPPAVIGVRCACTFRDFAEYMTPEAADLSARAHVAAEVARTLGGEA